MDFYHLNLKHCNVNAEMIINASKFHGAKDLRLNINEIPELPSETHSFFQLPVYKVQLPSGVEFKYRQTGHGPDVLLVHGLWTTSYTFRSLIGHLAGSCHLVLPELIDYDSLPSGDGQDFTPSYIASLIAGICEALGLQKPILVGHEESGLAAMEMALQDPGLISGALAISPRTSSSMGSRISAWWRSRSDAAAWARSAFSQPIKAALGMLNYADSAVVSRQELRVLAKGWSTLPMAAYRARVLAATMSRDYPRATMDLLSAMAESGKSLDVPLRLVYGDMDSNAPASHGEAIISLLPGTELLVAEGCGTAAQIERPRWTAEVITNSLQDR